MMKVQIELYFPNQNISFETLEGEYNVIRRSILHSLIDTITQDVPDLSSASKTQIKKIANELLVFRLEAVNKGSWELVAISVPIIYYIGRVLEKVAVGIISKNKNYAEFQDLMNEWVDRLILNKLIKRLKQKLEGKEKYEKVLIEHKKDDPLNELLKVRVELKRKDKRYVLKDEEAKQYLETLFEKRDDDT